MSVEEKLDLRAEFETQGYIIVRKFFSEDEVDELRLEIKKAGESLEKPSGLNKGDLIFYSNVFLKSAYIQSFITQEKVVDLLKDIVGNDFWVRWDQCVAKGPEGAAFPWHQDNAYNKLKDRHFQFWVAITEMTQENGGLWLQPGSHRNGLLPHRKVENHWVCELEPENEVFIYAEKGDVVLFSSMMLHHTKKNRSNSDRWAYVVEYMSLDHYDPLAKPPFFIAAEEGKPCQKFVQSYRGYSNFKNRMKYIGPWLKDRTRRIRKALA